MKIKAILIFFLVFTSFTAKSNDTTVSNNFFSIPNTLESSDIYLNSEIFPSPQRVKDFSGNIISLYPVISAINPATTAIWTNGHGKYYYGGEQFDGWWPWPCPFGYCGNPVGSYGNMSILKGNYWNGQELISIP